ncbi:MAG: 30S ribosomal protein S27ae [Candidatus Hadarchaeales archaeon]
MVKRVAKGEQAKTKYYKVEGGKLKVLRRYCPRCGPGVFMAEHEDRWSCGRCGYAEFKKGKS